jgi:hypothetical protein
MLAHVSALHWKSDRYSVTVNAHTRYTVNRVPIGNSVAYLQIGSADHAGS